MNHISLLGSDARQGGWKVVGQTEVPQLLHIYSSSTVQNSLGVYWNELLSARYWSNLQQDPCHVQLVIGTIQWDFYVDGYFMSQKLTQLRGWVSLVL